MCLSVCVLSCVALDLLIDSSTRDFLGCIMCQLRKIQQGDGFRLLALSDSEAKTNK